MRPNRGTGGTVVTHSYTMAGATAHDYRLAKVLGVLAVTASAVAAEYGAGINFVSTQSLSVYPGVHGLVPLAMFVTGILMLPKTYLFVMFSRVMPRAGSKYVWIARSLGVPAGFLVTFVWWATGPAGAGVLAFAFGTFLGQAVLRLQPGASVRHCCRRSAISSAVSPRSGSPMPSTPPGCIATGCSSPFCCS